MNADYVWKLSKFGRLTSTRLRFDDDFADRLNYQFTGLLLFVFVGIIGIRQYVGKPIHCWTPQEFTRSWEEFAENYCWVASTYFAHFSTVPGHLDPTLFYRRSTMSQGAQLIPVGYRHNPQPFLIPAMNQMQAGEKLPAGRLISYYQWAPILLAIQSFMFYFPCLIWRLFSPQSGFHLRRIMQLAADAALAAPTEADASGSTQPIQETNKSTLNRMSLQNVMSVVQQGATSELSSFAPTKSVRTLARYLDMCFMRQRELRLAGCKSDRCAQIKPYKPAVSPVPNPHRPNRYGVDAEFSEIKNHVNYSSTFSNAIGESIRKPTSQMQDQALSTSKSIKNCRPSDKCNMCESSYTSCLDSICCLRDGVTCYPEKRRYCFKNCPCARFCMKRSTSSSFKASFDQPFKQVHLTSKNNHAFGLQTSMMSRTSKHPRDDKVHKSCNDCSLRELKELTRHRAKTNGLCGKHQGNYLVRLHLLVKLLYLFNTVGQIYLMGYYTGASYHFYGIRVLYDLAMGKQWEESGHFPRVTFCDFEARKLAHSHYYTLQCVLPINMFLEKIYIFLWLWIFVVGLITFGSVVVWAHRLGTAHRRYNWIRRQLITIRQLNRSTHSTKAFVESHLGPDGVFILRLIAQNYGDLVSGDAIGELWSSYWLRRDSGSISAKQNKGDVKDPFSAIEELADTPTTQSNSAIGSTPYRPPRPIAAANPKTSTVHSIKKELSGKSPRQREKRKKQWFNAGYPVTMLATEMIHPSERFAVPLMTPSRRPQSFHSNDTSSDSRDNKNREDSLSPPPIPQRSSGSTDRSLDERCTIPELGDHRDSSSNNGNHMNTETAIEERCTQGDGDEAAHDDQFQNVNTDKNDQETYVEGEAGECLTYYSSYGDEYHDDFQVEENIV